MRTLRICTAKAAARAQVSGVNIRINHITHSVAGVEMSGRAEEGKQGLQCQDPVVVVVVVAGAVGEGGDR